MPDVAAPPAGATVRPQQEARSSGKVSSRAELCEALDRARVLSPVKLGELLVQQRKLTPEQLETALDLQKRCPGRHLGEVLTGLGLISRNALYAVLCTKLGAPFVDVLRFDIEPAALATLPEEVMRSEHVLPLCYRDGALVVAVPDVFDAERIARIRFLVDRPVRAVMAIAEEIDRVVGGHAPPPRHGVEEIANELRSEITPEIESQQEMIRETDSTLVRLVNRIITDAHAAGASDIHVESNGARDNVLVRFRVDGELSDYLSVPFNFRSAMVSRLKIMAGLDISERRRAQDGRINFRHFGTLDLELRMVTVPTRDGLEDVVLRLLSAREPLPVEQLGLPETTLAACRRLAEKPHGLILAVGPTGSGKTTTLHALVGLINRPGVKIWTAENPVEITQPRLRQVQVNARIGWDFATVMRAFLRADPDVIMVGEMRDRETAGIAIEASLTGHLVLSTLHTNSAAETVVRLLDMGLDPFGFTDSLLAVLGQRLARRLCTRCRTPQPLTAGEAHALAQDYCHESGLDPESVLSGWMRCHPGGLVLYRTTGCEACRQTGYRGRVGLFELLEVTPALRRMMLAREAAADLQRAAVAAGMRTMKHDGIEKSLAGLTDLREVHAAAL